MDQNNDRQNEEPLRTKVLNVVIPEATYWHLRRCATASQMSMKEFMATFCLTATSFISPTVSPASNEVHSIQCPGKAA